MATLTSAATLLGATACTARHHQAVPSLPKLPAIEGPHFGRVGVAVGDDLAPYVSFLPDPDPRVANWERHWRTQTTRDYQGHSSVLSTVGIRGIAHSVTVTHFRSLGVSVLNKAPTPQESAQIQDAINVLADAASIKAAPGMQRVRYGALSFDVPAGWSVGSNRCGGARTDYVVIPTHDFGFCPYAGGVGPYQATDKVVSIITPADPNRYVFISKAARQTVTVASAFRTQFAAYTGLMIPKGIGISPSTYLRIPAIALALEISASDMDFATRLIASARVDAPQAIASAGSRFQSLSGMSLSVPSNWKVNDMHCAELRSSGVRIQDNSPVEACTPGLQLPATYVTEVRKPLSAAWHGALSQRFLNDDRARSGLVFRGPHGMPTAVLYRALGSPLDPVTLVESDDPELMSEILASVEFGSSCDRVPCVHAAAKPRHQIPRAANATST